MSGIIGSKINIRGAGRIAKLGTDGQALTSGGAGVAANYEDIAAGISWQAVETGSTMTAVAGEGYWINTTSNACTITLPASASVGDTIIFADYARNWGTNGIVIDSNGLNYQGDDDTFDVEYGTDGQVVKITYMDATQGWVPTLDKTVTDAPVQIVTNENGIFGFGETGSKVSMTNLVNSSGVIATDVTGVGTARVYPAACEYGGDKAIFAYGNADPAMSSLSNLVSNTGVVASDVTGVGSARFHLAGSDYGGDKGIFVYGENLVITYFNASNLVSNVGVVATDTTGVGTARGYAISCEYGGDKDKSIAIYGYTGAAGNISVSNLISNTGVVATDTAGVGSARRSFYGCSYGSDKGIIAYGYISSVTAVSNLISNTGVIGTDVSGVGSTRYGTAATQYGTDKGIFAYGNTDGPNTSLSNLVSNTGVVAADVTGVGSARVGLAACSYN